MEGVNVGANIPIGGVIGVGVNKTIGKDQPPKPKVERPEEDSEEREPQSDWRNVLVRS